MQFPWLVPSFLSILVLSLPAQAARLQSWQFDTHRNRLDFTTEDSVQPKAQLIANPTRLVIDLPGIKLGHPKVNQSVGGAIQSVRVGQLDPHTTRLVIELAPGYTLNPKQLVVRDESSTHWFVQLPTPQLSRTLLEDQDIVASQPGITAPVAADTFDGLVSPGRHLNWLEQRVGALKSKYSFLQCGIFFLDMETGNYLNVDSEKIFPAASIIKLPILIAFFQDLDAGKISLSEKLVMEPKLIASGSGTMQHLPPWRRFSALETVTKMITISDNTATNMIIKRLGGAVLLNQRFRSWGLQNTVIHKLLPDLRGTNTTDSKDLVRLLALLDKEKLVSSQSREQALDILRHTTIKTLLPAGLGPGANIAHKTGDIGFIIGDAGIIEMPNGKHYLAAVLVRRPYDDPRGRNFIRQVSQTVYTYLSQPIPTPLAGPSNR